MSGSRRSSSPPQELEVSRPKAGWSSSYDDEDDDEDDGEDEDLDDDEEDFLQFRICTHKRASVSLGHDSLGASHFWRLTDDDDDNGDDDDIYDDDDQGQIWFIVKKN